ncbi:phage major capsid protein [Blautia obeum]|jgi:HK97 family phage major capsid protein|uniref:phage major capsid protein n=1 Tax=Blautia obeum TaxID=40520 RepID=UPI000E435C32|nr:phage major capsid protein [Blautia obeum]MCB6333521.1 phage major capsid protein [Blautia obeum]MCQ5356643.1 phage major capsid protein [Blautia obeum]RGI91946.1 phage major capsid protein [Blautia obeum]
MNKKLLELLDKINNKKVEVRSLVDQGKIEEAKAAKDELKKLQDEFDILKDIDDTAVTNLENNTNKGVNFNQKKDSVKEFADAARKGFRNSMNEGTAADGGYTVPEDIQTRINERRTAKTSLIDLVDVENVTTNKGSRTFKKRTQQTGFTKIGEGGKLSAGSTPQFERMSYEIAKYAGYFPVTNELLEDSDANITDTLVTWIGDESRVTRNKIILGVIDQKAKTTIKSLDDIKEALNVTLGQAFKQTSCIVTNDDGLQWLDTLKNDRGEYLLQPSPADPMKMVLCAGATTVPVKVIPNDDMPSDTTTKGTTKIPVIIGDLKEGIKFFDRKRLTLITSNIAVAGELNAFEEDLTLFRAIEREDCKTKDDAAFVNGVLTITEATE